MSLDDKPIRLFAITWASGAREVIEGTHFDAPRDVIVWEPGGTRAPPLWRVFRKYELVLAAAADDIVMVREIEASRGATTGEEIG